MKNLRGTLLAIPAFLGLVACSDPMQTKFVGNCIDGGNSDDRCSCTYQLLEREVGTIDDEFIDFVADFAKWSVKKGDEPLEKSDMMAKYELSEEDFHDLSGVVGNAMLRALNACE